MVAIKLLLTENPYLPTAFNFKGNCLLEKLLKDYKEIGIGEQDQIEK